MIVRTGRGDDLSVFEGWQGGVEASLTRRFRPGELFGEVERRVLEIRAAQDRCPPGWGPPPSARREGGSPEPANRCSEEVPAVELVETVREAIRTLVLPELSGIREQLKEQSARLDVTNHRISDMHDHLVLQSQRLDQVSRRQDQLNERVDQLIQRQDDVRRELLERIEAVRHELLERIEAVRHELLERMEAVRRELLERMEGLEAGFDQLRRDVDFRLGRMDARLDQLYAVMVRPEDIAGLRQRLERLEGEVEERRRASGE